MKTITFLASAELSPNMEAELKGFARMLHPEFQLNLITGAPPSDPAICQAYTLFLHTPPQRDLLKFGYAFGACAAFLRRHKTDLLINVTQPATLGLATSLSGKWFNTPTLVRMTGILDEYRCFTSPWRRIKSRLLHRTLSLVGFRNATRVVALGNNLASALVEAGISRDKITVLPQPFNARAFAPAAEGDKPHIKTRLGLEPHRKTLLFVGRLSFLKGADRLVKIIEGVGRASNDFQFCIIGDGPFGEQLKALPPSLVHCTGRVPHREIPAYFQAADLLVFPSRAEGLPNTILEALACKVPVLAAPVGDMDNWVSWTHTEPDAYVQAILNQDWALDPLLPIMEPERLKAGYHRLFHQIPTTHKETF